MLGCPSQTSLLEFQLLVATLTKKFRPFLSYMSPSSMLRMSFSSRTVHDGVLHVKIYYVYNDTRNLPVPKACGIIERPSLCTELFTWSGRANVAHVFFYQKRECMYIVSVKINRAFVLFNTRFPWFLKKIKAIFFCFRLRIRLWLMPLRFKL